MSKRSGDFVSLDELLDDIGADATRWFMLWRSHDTTVDLDLELARRQSNDNPVYYVQYAHARIASILRKAGARAEEAAATDAPAPGATLEPAEKELVKRLLEFPERGSRGGRAPRAAPDLRLLDRGRRRFPRLLPRLQGGRRRGRGGGGVEAGALSARQADDRRARSGCSASLPQSGCDVPPPPPGPGGAPCAGGRVGAPGGAEPRRAGTARRGAAGDGRRTRGARDRGGGEVGAVAGPRDRRRGRGPSRQPCVECDLAMPSLARRARPRPDPGPARVPARGGRGTADPPAARPRRSGLRPGRRRRSPASLPASRPRTACRCSTPRASTTRRQAAQRLRPTRPRRPAAGRSAVSARGCRPRRQDPRPAVRGRTCPRKPKVPVDWLGLPGLVAQRS